MIKQNFYFDITERPFFLRIQTLSALTIMARHPDSEYGFTFTNVEIFQDQELGHGSYRAVYKAKCDSLPCAAKLIYPVLFASNIPQQAPKHRTTLGSVSCARHQHTCDSNGTHG